MAYLSGNYDPANPPSDSGAPSTAIPPPAPADDLQFNPADQMAGGDMAQADRDDLGGLLDAIDGAGPAAERSSMAIPEGAEPDPNAPPKPIE